MNNRHKQCSLSSPQGKEILKEKVKMNSKLTRELAKTERYKGILTEMQL